MTVLYPIEHQPSISDESEQSGKVPLSMKDVVTRAFTSLQNEVDETEMIFPEDGLLPSNDSDYTSDCCSENDYFDDMTVWSLEVDDNDDDCLHDTTTRTTPQEKKEHKRVSFSHCEVREYRVVIGDHPCCGDGIPLSLGWEHAEETQVYDIDACVEKNTCQEGVIVLSPMQRKERLRRVSLYSRNYLNLLEERLRIAVEDFSD
mmetsp:Transcript_34622/g.53130  ORF Transcript_34622/g.53130 Transcript_34622/m.53130 type:complete len:203 (+) Transcript_34622:58-666(+)